MLDFAGGQQFGSPRREGKEGVHRVGSELSEYGDSRADVLDMEEYDGADGGADGGADRDAITVRASNRVATCLSGVTVPFSSDTLSQATCVGVLRWMLASVADFAGVPAAVAIAAGVWPWCSTTSNAPAITAVVGLWGLNGGKRPDMEWRWRWSFQAYIRDVTGFGHEEVQDVVGHLREITLNEHVGDSLISPS
jgi:hypothetical protein